MNTGTYSRVNLVCLEKIMVGTIVHFNESRGYGFIATREAQYFFHLSQFKGLPVKGAQVSFEPAPPRIPGKTPSATNVRPLAELTANEIVERLTQLLDGGARHE